MVTLRTVFDGGPWLNRWRWRLLRTELAAWIEWRLAWLVPRRIAILVFVRVYCAGLDHPTEDYATIYQAWEAGAGR